MVRAWNCSVNFIKKHSKKIGWVIGLLVVVIVIGIMVVSHVRGGKKTLSIKEGVTESNFSVEQGDGLYYLNGGYIILQTDDECKYISGTSAVSYHIREYLQDKTNKTGYCFTSGKYEDVKYGETEAEIIETMENYFGKTIKETGSVYTASGKWKQGLVENYEFEGNPCDVKIFYQLKKEHLYIVQMYVDDSSENPESLLEQLTLLEEAVIVYKNENPVKFAEDGTGYFTQNIAETEYEFHVPEDVGKNYQYDKKEQYALLVSDDMQYVTCRIVSEEELGVKGAFEQMAKYAGAESINEMFDSVVYDSFETEDGRKIEYEYATFEDEEFWIKAQIDDGTVVYGLEINRIHPIENIHEYLSNYYVK